MRRTRVLIMGAAGRDFHNFNVRYREDPMSHVVGFTASQIPDIAGRRYPSALAGPLYPGGLPIYPEDELPELVRGLNVNVVVLAYSDLSHEDVMHKASIALANGASFLLLGPDETALASEKPVVSVCAVRTGAGKSPTTRFVARWLRERGHRVAVVRHPMPYGDLELQAAQRFASMADVDEGHCTIEEREEYEPHLRDGNLVFAGVDYERVLRLAEREADVILWDGGNNDFPFIRPDLHIVLVDPHRAGHELRYHPGETNLRAADVLIISKSGTAKPEDVERVAENARATNPDAPLVRADLRIALPEGASIRGKRALVVEDGPTVTHGGMAYGAGTLAARQGGATLVDAEPFAVGSLREVYREHPHLHHVVPAMGYSDKQLDELGETLRRVPCDVILDASPVDLGRLVKVDVPILNVGYEFDDLDGGLAAALRRFEEARL